MAIRDANSFAPGRMMILVTDNRNLGQPVKAIARRSLGSVNGDDCSKLTITKDKPTPMTNLMDRAIYFVNSDLASSFLERAVIRKPGCSYHIAPAGSTVQTRSKKKVKPRYVQSTIFGVDSDV